MNIFKILCSGDGNLKEPNVSAFLGYLLNPRADHGLNSEFLKAFIEPLVKPGNGKDWEITKNLWNKEVGQVRDLSSVSRFDVDVYYEKAFRTEQNNIVDIVIKITEKPSEIQNGATVFQTNKPVALILIENKIRENRSKELQLNEQYKGTLDLIGQLEKTLSAEYQDIFKTNCYSIFVTSDHKEYVDQWNTFINASLNAKDNHTLKGVHILWTEFDQSTATSTVAGMLSKIINDENIGEIEPVQEYTKHTLKAFLNFIWADFDSEVDEAKEGRKSGPNDLLYGKEAVLEKFNKDVNKTEQYNLLNLIINNLQGNFDKLRFIRASNIDKRGSFPRKSQIGKLVYLQFWWENNNLDIRIDHRYSSPQIFSNNNLIMLELDSSRAWTIIPINGIEDYERYKTVIFDNINNQVNKQKFKNRLCVKTFN